MEIISSSQNSLEIERFDQTLGNYVRRFSYWLHLIGHPTVQRTALPYQPWNPRDFPWRTLSEVDSSKSTLCIATSCLNTIWVQTELFFFSLTDVKPPFYKIHLFGKKSSPFLTFFLSIEQFGNDISQNPKLQYWWIIFVLSSVQDQKNICICFFL